MTTYANFLHRQGDVALRLITSLVPDFSRLTPKPDAAVAYGEHSGHAHVATGKATHVFEWEGKTYVSVGGDGGALEHIHLPTGRKADHNAITLTPGVYEVVYQNQFNPFSKLMERVLD